MTMSCVRAVGRRWQRADGQMNMYAGRGDLFRGLTTLGAHRPFTADHMAPHPLTLGPELD